MISKSYFIHFNSIFVSFQTKMFNQNQLEFPQKQKIPFQFDF